MSLISFYQQLAADRDLLQAFMTDFKNTVEQSGLSEVDKEIVLSGNFERIQAAVQEELGEAGGGVVAVFCVLP